MRWTPHATVATIIEHEGRFLMVEEVSGGRKVINQPAGHIEPNEHFIDAAVRETLEETGWHVRIDALLGLYVYQSPRNGVTYHRMCFKATAIEHDPKLELDTGIIGPVWLSRDELAQRHDELRSELVLQCIDDCLAGQQFPLSFIHEPQEFPLSNA